MRDHTAKRSSFIEKAQQQKAKNYTYGIAIGAFAKIINQLYNFFAFYVWQFIQRNAWGINIRTRREVISKHGGVEWRVVTRWLVRR